MYVLNVSEDVLGEAQDVLARVASGEDVANATGELQGIVAVAQRAKREGAEVVAVARNADEEPPADGDAGAPGKDGG